MAKSKKNRNRKDPPAPPPAAEARRKTAGTELAIPGVRSKGTVQGTVARATRSLKDLA